jgi:hypothetical protein
VRFAHVGYVRRPMPRRGAAEKQWRSMSYVPVSPESSSRRRGDFPWRVLQPAPNTGAWESCKCGAFCSREGGTVCGFVSPMCAMIGPISCRAF